MKTFLLLLNLFTLLGCKKDESCIINYYISGTVKTAGADPILGVDIFLTDHYNYTSVKPYSSTDAVGKFRYFLGSYSDLGNSYVLYRKAGYSDLATAPIGKGNGNCGDQEIVRDGVMIP
jgi:hypothetical protein